MIILILLSILSIIVVLIIDKKYSVFKIEYSKKKKISLILITIIMIGFCRASALYKLGEPVSAGAWNSWKIPKNIYENFNNKNRSLMVSGLYEYPFRDVYIYVKQRINSDSKKKVEEVNDYLEDINVIQEENEYTGIFKDKNLIMIMMESIDDWLVNEEVMPTLTYLKETGINFENRYAPFFGGAMTINSEFASISGLYSVVSEKAIYNYNDNDFNYSLPNLFKNNGYTVNSIHMNNSEFYNRKIFI